MAISTYPITLKYDSSATETANWTDVCDVKDFPDLGGAPEMLDTTTLSQAARTYIAGIKDQQALEFTANYDDGDMDDIAALTGTKKISSMVWHEWRVRQVCVFRYDNRLCGGRWRERSC